jgi:hypothetical protein
MPVPFFVPLHPFSGLLCLVLPLLLGSHAFAQSPSPSASGNLPPSAGLWGTLTKIPIYLEAPSSMIESLPLPSPITRWSFPAAEATNLPAFLASIGLQNSLISRLNEPDLQLSEGKWFHLFPPAEEVALLDPEVRSRLYAHLGRHEINEYQFDPVRILTPTVEEWFKTTGLRPELVSAISKVAYRLGDIWALSDLSYILSLANNEAEARRLFQAFTRTRSYLVKLIVNQDSDIEAIRNYWSIGGKSFRRKALEPLLKSLQETQQTVELDLAHIIPALPRKLIHTYQSPSYATQGIFPDCHWTSLNFFNYEPHNYLLDSRLSTSKVLDDFSPAEAPYAYGDVLFFLREDDGNAFHSCLYLADNLVFTKNGRNQFAPWIISTIEEVSSMYFATAKGHIQAYRRKDNFADFSE